MGWTCFYDNVGLSIDDTLRKEFNDTGPNGAQWRVIDSATRGSQWYAILEYTGVGEAPKYSGMVCLVKRSKRTGEFCYKDIGEAAGPNASHAPKRLIDKLDILAPIAPADDSYGAKWARQWRERCRANASAKANRFKPFKGAIVRFGDSASEYELIESAGQRRGWYAKLLNGSGMLYRASAKQISKAKLIEGV